MAGVREFFQSSAGKTVAVVVVIIGIIAAGVSIWANIGAPAEVADANAPVFINKAGQTKRITLGPNVQIPPGFFKAELCNWTKDGKPKDSPTYVLLNTYQGLPEPTFCPDCGRLVVGHNPPATEGKRPPPTQAEYKAQRAR